MPAASLGHYASLSFVVIGRSEIINSVSWILTAILWILNSDYWILSSFLVPCALRLEP
jgi:hypothetical protein